MADQYTSHQQVSAERPGLSDLQVCAGIVEATRVRLRDLKASDLIVVSDMTGTLINQGAGGFSTRQKDNIQQLLEGGGILVLVTADPLSAVRRHFLDHLGYEGGGALYVISSAGYEGYKIAASSESPEPLFIGKEIELKHRTLFLESFRQALEKALNTDVSFDPQVVGSLLGAGARASLQYLDMDNFGDGSAIDIFPGKSSIFFLDPKTPRALGNAVFDEILKNPDVMQVVADESLHILKGHNYLDILSNSKGDGLKHLSAGYRGLWRNRHVLVLGDSANDESLFTFNYGGTCSPVMRVFVGEDPALVTRVNLQLEASGQSPLGVMPASYTAGTEDLLAVLGAPSS